MEWAKVKTGRLLLIAGIVWAVAGFNILNLGVRAFLEESGIPVVLALLIAAVVVFAVFHRFVFSGLVAKHADRIKRIGDARSYFWRFFDVKGFVMMAAMMTMGIMLRSSGIAPEWFVAFFYTGLGSALFLSGVSFLGRYVKDRPLCCPFSARAE